ncbi:MAG TPA: hypothetical protein DDW18_02305 [Firmicutes bacterium]|nr:hypothetical protein [Bacillota bacterium]HBN00046.1 hypothetical protein [Bacillota bacterium]
MFIIVVFIRVLIVFLHFFCDVFVFNWTSHTIQFFFASFLFGWFAFSFFLPFFRRFIFFFV